MLKSYQSARRCRSATGAIAGDPGDPHWFRDDASGNGHYPFALTDFVKQRLCDRILRFHLVRTCDLFLAPGMRTAVAFVKAQFMDSVRARLAPR